MSYLVPMARSGCPCHQGPVRLLPAAPGHRGSQADASVVGVSFVGPWGDSHPEDSEVLAAGATLPGGIWGT